MKQIIDIPDELFSIFKKHGIMAFDYVNEYDKDQIAIAITHGTPYNQQGDLISREALKKELQENGWITNDPYDESGGLEEIIDNAPTIFDRYDEGYAQGYIDGSTGADWKGD